MGFTNLLKYILSLNNVFLCIHAAVQVTALRKAYS